LIQVKVNRVPGSDETSKNYRNRGGPMPYKTILVHLNDLRRAEKMLEPALYLAQRCNAHLIGLHVYPSVVAPPVPLPGGRYVAGTVHSFEREESDAIAAIFSKMTANQPFVSEWRSLMAPLFELPSVVLEQARRTDLIIAGQADPSWDFSLMLDFPERLALESGRPVLVIPYAGHCREIGRNVVIAWKPTREAARAVFDALPLLMNAERVHVIEVRQSAGTSLMPDTSIAAALGRHGIKPTVHSAVQPDSRVGEEILSRLADVGADLLVMGAYGHSRFREYVLGGATRHIAQHMTVATLWSH
jgi:nucleotide-binding universal stress UspA family protein